MPVYEFKPPRRPRRRLFDADQRAWAAFGLTALAMTAAPFAGFRIPELFGLVILVAVAHLLSRA
jgi:hypothetical protein